MKRFATRNESLAILQEPAAEPASATSSTAPPRESFDFQDAKAIAFAPTVQPDVAVHVAVRRGRLVLLSAAAVAFVAALTLGFSRRGVVVETFDRRELSMSDQEKLLEKYNSYSGTVTALLERPVELYMALVAQVILLRVMTRDVLQVERRPRVAATALALGVGATYLLSNGLSAVNVQVRELGVESVISAGELASPRVDAATVSTMERSFSEDRPGNPATNTILRNLLLPRAADPRPTCSDRDFIDPLDLVDYHIPQHAWMAHVLPTALNASRLKLAVTNRSDANAQLTPEQFPMDARVAADLLLYSRETLGEYNAWGTLAAGLEQNNLSRTLFKRDAQSGVLQGPTARLTGLLPPALDTSERADRLWFLQHAGSTMFGIADREYKNASLRGWTMELAHVDLVPGAVWADAITIERVVAPPRLVTNVSRDGNTTYLALQWANREASPTHVELSKAGGGVDEETIDVYRACGGEGAAELLVSSQSEGTNGTTVECATTSTRSLLFLSRTRRLEADAVVENATLANGSLAAVNSATDSGGIVTTFGVAVNVREVFVTTVLRVSWATQDLAKRYNAKCDAPDARACEGIDVALPGAHQRLVVNASELPVALPSPLLPAGLGLHPLSLVSVRRPRTFVLFRATGDASAFVGDVLMPHNVRNLSVTARAPGGECDPKRRTRLVTYVNNHAYMDTTLQATYTAAAFFLFQNGVVRDELNTTTKATTTNGTTASVMLAFDANTQAVEVYVYIPRLNVVLSLTGCVLLVAATVAVVLWPAGSSSSSSSFSPGASDVDPLARITAPHLVARVLLDNGAYPSLLLSKRAVADDARLDGGRADDVVIQSIALQRKQQPDQQSAMAQV